MERKVIYMSILLTTFIGFLAIYFIVSTVILILMITIGDITFDIESYENGEMNPYIDPYIEKYIEDNIECLDSEVNIKSSIAIIIKLIPVVVKMIMLLPIRIFKGLR